MQVRFTAFALALVSLAAGCQQHYQEPPAADNPATLVGVGGTYINEVDGVHVRSAEVASAAGGNTVRVAPGERRVRAYTLASGTRAPGLWRFTHRFEPGRAYEVSPGNGAALSLQLRDRSTGTVVDVN